MDQFLAALSAGGQAAGGAASLLQLFGLGGKDRPSWRDMQFMMDTSERLQPRQIALEGGFLEGMAPYQGNAHNAYQDTTFGEDTRRQTERIETMGADLGMSPWELTGGSASGALPSPQANTSGASSGQFMSALVPLQTAKIQQQTQIAQALLSRQTALDTTKMQTNNGEVGKAQTLQTAAQTILTGAQTENANASTENIKQQTATGEAQENLLWTQSAAAENQMWLNSIAELAKWAGTTSVSLGPYSSTTTNNYPELVKLYTELSNVSGLARQNEFITQYFRNMPKDQFARVEKDAKRAAEMVLKMGGDAISGMGKGLGDFLKGLGIGGAGTPNALPGGL